MHLSLEMGGGGGRGGGGWRGDSRGIGFSLYSYSLVCISALKWGVEGGSPGIGFSLYSHCYYAYQSWNGGVGAGWREVWSWVFTV